MSTAIAVSAFYDVDISCSNQNRRNLAHTGGSSSQHHRSTTSTTSMLSTSNTELVKSKAVGTPITGPSRNRNVLERSMSEPIDRNSNHQSTIQQQNQANRANVNSSRYKTELCRPYEESGYCKYGDKCQFAHGLNELRSLARHPKYKTELCRTFHTIGFCPYGPRCHFMHNDEERVNVKTVVDQQQQNHHSQHLPQSVLPSAIGQQCPGRISPPLIHQRSSRFSLPLPITRDSLGSTADSPTSSETDSPVMSPTFVGDADMLSSPFQNIQNNHHHQQNQHHCLPQAPMSAPPTTNNPFRNAFNFHDLTAQQAATIMSPLNIHTDPMAGLTAGLQAVSLSQNQLNNNMNLFNSLQHQKSIGMFGLASLSGLAALMEDNIYAPPSPPDSLSGDSNSSSSTSSSSSGMSTSSMCGSPLEVSRGLRLPIFTTLSHEKC